MSFRESKQHECRHKAWLAADVAGEEFGFHSVGEKEVRF